MNPLMRSRLGCWLQSQQSMVAASVVEVNGSAPHEAGLALVANSEGEVVGAVSGGCVDGAIVEACDDVLRTGQSRALTFDADPGEFGEPGLICGGGLKVWVYPLSAADAQSLIESDEERLLVLRGDRDSGPTSLMVTELNGHAKGDKTSLRQVSATEWEFQERFGERRLVVLIGLSGFTQALVALGRLLRCEVLVCDPRPRFQKAATEADRSVVELPDRFLEALAAEQRLNADSAILVCTHDPKFDEPALLAAVRSPAGFIGAIGSRKTAEDRLRRLQALGLTPEECRRIHSPLGLDLGAETAEETAVSIYAEWIAARRGGTGSALRTLRGPIHARS